MDFPHNPEPHDKVFRQPPPIGCGWVLIVLAAGAGIVWIVSRILA